MRRDFLRVQVLLQRHRSKDYTIDIEKTNSKTLDIMQNEERLETRRVHTKRTCPCSVGEGTICRVGKEKDV